LGVVADHLSFPAAVARRDRGHSGPHPLVELAAKLLDEALLVLANLRVSLGEQNLSEPGLHAKELDGGPPLKILDRPRSMRAGTRRLCQRSSERRSVRCGHLERPAGMRDSGVRRLLLSESEHIDGASAGA